MTIDDVVSQLRLSRRFLSEQERCVAIHDFVRDEIAFGFSVSFEAVSPEQTLERRLGHCNAQADLFRALLAAVGIPARLRFVSIRKEVLRGAVPPLIFACLPGRLFHGITQVKIDNVWRNTDSYLFPPVTFTRQKRRLAQTGRSRGFGLTAGARCDWSADADALCQATPDDLTDDDPIFPCLADALASRRNNSTLMGIHFNRWLGGIPRPLTFAVEGYLNSRLRNDG